MKSFLVEMKHRGMSHKSRIKDQTGRAQRTDCFQKLLAPVNLHGRYCVLCCHAACLVYCLNFFDLGLRRPQT